MTAIVLGRRASDRGVSIDAYRRGMRKLCNHIGTHQDAPEPERTVELVRSLPRDEAIAVVRMEEYDKRYPEAFDWNGARA